MHALRTSQTTVRLILAWFVLMLGVAGASPIVHPKAMQIVCSAGTGVQVVSIGDDGQPSKPGQHTLDCSLCLAAVLPVSPIRVALTLPPHQGHALKPAFVAPVAALVGPPLPPRGPPLSFA